MESPGKNVPKKTFSLYNQILDFTKYNDRYILPTIPNVHRNLRIHFQDEMYHLAKNMFGSMSSRVGGAKTYDK